VIEYHDHLHASFKYDLRLGVERGGGRGRRGITCKKSGLKGYQSAVMPSEEVTALRATTLLCVRWSPCTPTALQGPPPLSALAKPSYIPYHWGPTAQPLRVVQPDAVCEVGGSTPGLSHGDLGIFLGGGQTEEFVH